MQVNKI